MAVVCCRPITALRSPSAATRSETTPSRAPCTSWLHWLGRQTVQHHVIADRTRLAVLDATSITAYRQFLERVYGFEAAVERQSSMCRGVDVALYGARARLARLREDLAHLGLTGLEVESLPRPPVDIRKPADVLGWLYVIERHVLLAAFIHRALERDRPSFAGASHYFGTHADGGARLREFIDALRTHVVHADAGPDGIIASARKAFEAQHHWYTRQQKRPITQPLATIAAGEHTGTKARRSVA
jgi:heme oxygenase